MMQTPNEPAAELGNPIGQLKSRREGFQMVVCVIAVIGGFAAGFGCGLDAHLFLFVVVAVTLIIAGIVYFFAGKTKRFSDRLELHELGMQLILQGEEHRVRFADVEQYRIGHKHHMYNGNYAGSRAELEIVLEGRLRPIKCDFEYHQDRSTGQLITEVTRRLSNALRDRLAGQLEDRGEVRWSSHVYLTMDGLRIIDSPNGDEREIPIEEIDRWQVADNQLSFWKADEGMPFLVMSIDEPNFTAIAELFTSLHACYRQQDVATEEVLV